MANDGLEIQLEGWLRDVESASLKSAHDREQVTKAGAEALAKHIEQATREHHTGDVSPHLADSVTFTGTDVDGRHDGTATAGYSKKAGLGYIARFLNDGTVKRQGDHFVDNARRAAVPDVIAAERAAYKKLMDGKG